MVDKVPGLVDVQQMLLDHVAATDDMPFGQDVIVYRVCGKMFALLAWQEQPMRINLKCDPVEADMLRAQYPVILPGYHMNKKHWNTVVLDGSLSWEFVCGQVHRSYQLVVSGLKKSERAALQEQAAS